MRIGEFSELFQLRPETVRFYINKGLLVPTVRHNRYLFSAQDEEDMEFLLYLKNLRFSLAEIHRILSLKRLSDFDSAEELNDYIAILKAQKKLLCREKSQLEEMIGRISHEMNHAKGKHTGKAKRVSGVPLIFLPYLACPHCQRSMNIEKCNIDRGQIISGTLVCACGYRAMIRNGIIIGEPGEVSIYDGPDLDRYCYRMMSPDLITLMKKNYQWMLEKLEHCPTAGKLILEDYINDYCFCHANFELMDEKGLYILADKFPEIVAMYKNLIEQMNLPHQILYIAAGSHLLPLKEHCIDLYIDLTTNEYAMFQQGCSMDALARYFHPETHGVGSFWHFDPGCESWRELYRQYPDAWDKNFDLPYFSQYLQRHWRQVEGPEYLGFVTDSGEEDSFSYHILGEILHLSSYRVRSFERRAKEIR